MGGWTTFVSALFVLGQTTSAIACIPYGFGRTHQDILLASKPVDVQPDCSLTNGGEFDDHSFGPAVDLGGGRIYQNYQNWNDRALVVDCNTREATFLIGPAIPGAFEGCEGATSPLIGPDGIVTLREGRDLAELEAIVRSFGGWFGNPVEEINSTYWGDPVWPRDQVDLLCGCKIFYPDSPGATQ